MKKIVNKALSLFTAGALASAFLPFSEKAAGAYEAVKHTDPIELEDFITERAGEHITLAGTSECFYPGCDSRHVITLSSEGKIHLFYGDCYDTVFRTTDRFDIDALNASLESKAIDIDIASNGENEYMIKKVNSINDFNKLVNELRFTGEVTDIQMDYYFLEDDANHIGDRFFFFRSDVSAEDILSNYELDLTPIDSKLFKDYTLAMRYNKYDQEDLAADYAEIKRLKENEDFLFNSSITCLYPIRDQYHCQETIYDKSDTDNAEIIFSDYELSVECGKEKDFEYILDGADEVSFNAILPGFEIENTCSDGKGVLTVKASDISSYGKYYINCYLKKGDTIITKKIPVNVSEPAEFHCPDCGRDVPISERVSGPLRSICKDCYEAGHYIGTTAPIHYNDTITTAVSSDTEPANQTNSTTVTIPALNADIVFKDEEIMLEVGEEKSFEYTVTGAEYVSFFSISDIRIVNNTFSDGKGVITLKTSKYSWGDDMVCTLRSGEAFVEKIIPVHIAEPTTFICPKCKREMPVSERIDGPYWWICRECYETQPIGSTRPQDANITTTSTTTVTIDPRSITAPKELCESGDVNLDGQTTIADAVAILQYIGNQDKYQLTDQGKKNADVDGVKGITPNDALAIMKWDSFENR